MKIIIIEDEKPASEKLILMLEKYDPGIRILAILRDVDSGIKWLNSNKNSYDLIFSDIKLTDGSSFDIFANTTVTAPVILITAYDEYALHAFKINSIDYLLKPVSYEALAASMKKVDTLKSQLGKSSPDLEGLRQMLTAVRGNYKERFMVKTGDHIRSIKTTDCVMFFADGRTVYLLDSNNVKHIVDYKLEALEGKINPADFFRVNRSCIININAIKDVLVYSNSRLRVVPDFPYDKEIIVSRDKVAPMKTWLEGKEY